jgi:nucleoid-associated protein YgaU
VIRALKQGDLQMSIFDFVKEAGKKIGLGPAPTPADLKAELDSHRIGTEGLHVDVKDSKAVLSGSAPNHDVLERAVVAIGNTIGISKVETDVKLPTPITGDAKPAAAPSSMYTVKKGDTLSAIAERVYGKGKAMEHSRIIFDANRPMLANPDKIYPGQVLRIPSLPQKTAA